VTQDDSALGGAMKSSSDAARGPSDRRSGRACTWRVEAYRLVSWSRQPWLRNRIAGCGLRDGHGSVLMPSQATLVESQHSFVQEARCHPPRSRTPPLVTLNRRVAHILGVFVLFLFAVMFGGEIMQGQTPNLKPQEILIFAAMAVQLIGLLIAFRKETPGGLMVLVGFLWQAVLLPRSALNPFFAVLPLTGLLRLSCVWLERPQAPPSHTVTGKRASHRIAVTVCVVLAVFLGLVSSENLMSPPLMAPRHVAVPAGLVGDWQGEARVPNTWVHSGGCL